METLLDADSAVSVVALTTSEEAEAFTALFADSAQEPCGQLNDALRTCPEQSVYLALRVGQTLAGGLLLVRPNPAGSLPLQQCWTEIELRNRDDIAQVALLVLCPQWRSKAKLFWPLCLELWRYCIRSGINELWLAVPAQTRRLYWKLGWPLAIRGPLRRHQGEHCYPCSLDLHRVAEAVRRKSKRSALYRRLVALGSPDLPEDAALQSAQTSRIGGLTHPGSSRH